MKASIENGELVIRIPINQVNFPSSKSEKTLIVASSNGNIKTDLEVNGKQVTIDFFINSFNDCISK